MDESLSFESFLEGAKKAAHRAMGDHGRKEYDEFALHAGIAVERLAKAVLVSKNPIYLVEMRTGNTDMLLYFGGSLALDRDRVRTVGAKDAIARLRRMSVLPSDPQLDLLIDLRNGTAHTSGRDEAMGLVPVLARTVESLARDLALDLTHFWGRWMQIMRPTMNERENKIVRDVQIRIVHARNSFEDRFAGLRHSERVKARALTEADERTWRILYPEDGEDTLMITGGKCPACEGYVELIYREIEGANTFEEHFPIGFRCTMCDLRLYGDEEMAVLKHLNGGQLPPAVRISQGPPMKNGWGETQED